MSKLDKAPIVHGNPTNFFAKKPFARPNEESVQNTNVTTNLLQATKLQPAKKRGRPKLEGQNKKSAKCSIIFSETQKEQLILALGKYNDTKKGDVFFTPPSMNEFIVTLIFSNPELKKLL